MFYVLRNENYKPNTRKIFNVHEVIFVSQIHICKTTTTVCRYFCETNEKKYNKSESVFSWQQTAKVKINKKTFYAIKNQDHLFFF